MLLPRYQEETRKAIEAINAVMGHLGGAALSVITDQNKLLMVVGGASALALGMYGAREAVRVGGRAAERWLGTPKLVRGGGGMRGPRGEGGAGPKLVRGGGA